MTEDKIFLDTNILVYAYDISSGKKHDPARNIVTDLWNSRTGAISVQVLQEFFVSITKKIPNPLDVKTASDIIRDFLLWEIIDNDGELMIAAMDIQARYRYSFWDSLIIAAAVKIGASVLLTEDLKNGQIIEDVMIKNPFK
ncbi:MAG: PIN domain-containing protein [Smithella sp.]|jgi:predicted nucleic acid-binding protein